MSKDGPVDDPSRRSFVKKAVYVTPAIVTLEAMPTLASYGSGNRGGNSQGGNDQGENEQD